MGRHSPTRPRLRSNESPSGAFEWQHGLRSKWRSLTPTSARPCDRTFSSIENLWPQVDTCFRPFRATLKISEVEPQCTLKILQSKTCEKAKSLLMVTVHTERSSCPCLCSGVVRLAHRKCEVMAQYLVQTAYEGFKVQLPKRKIPPCKTGEKFCRVKRRQNKSGVLRGGKNLHGK